MSLVRSADHRYRLNDGPWVPGVTSVIRVIDKPALIPWAKGVTADAALDNLVRFTEIFHTDGRPPARGWLIGHADQERDTAAALGSRVHALTEISDRGGELDVDVGLAQPYIDAYHRYLEDWKPEIKSLEQFIYNEAAGYGGTYDAIEVLTIDGKKVTVCRDTKTGKGVYSETRLQLAALSRPENIIGRPDDPKSYPMPRIDFGTILHLRPDAYERGYQLYRVIPSNADWHAFLGALAVYRWKQQRPTSGDPIQAEKQEKEA